MTLEKYLKENKILKKDFAKKIGILPSYLSNILSGNRNAGLCLAIRIEDATSGKVTCRDMLPKGIRNNQNK
jgi:DNA-binding transcriptional regulator YdaS (Cro superfamily)